MESQPEPDFEALLNRLKDSSVSLAKVGIQMLADLPREDATRLAQNWMEIDTKRRRAIAAAMVELAEENFELDFTSAFYVLTGDADPKVRIDAIEGLWESTTYETADLLVSLLRKDPEPEVRAAAATSLGRITYLIHMEKTDRITSQRVREALLAVYEDPTQPTMVKRRALEALAYICDDEITNMIAEAYRSDDEDFKASAIFAMGRNCDLKWADTIMAEMNSPEPAIRFEAARAAGELEDENAVPQLEEMISDPDKQVCTAAIIALGLIGGQRAKRALQKHRQSEDADIREAVEEALEEAMFLEEPLHFPMSKGEDDIDSMRYH
jgi:HEAT repeat protein